MLVEIAPGELVDKITILVIKLERITDPAKLRNVEHEHRVLTAVLPVAFQTDAKLMQLRGDLKAVNEIIWQVEDDIRDHERRKDFGPSFVELARAVYVNNDRRAALKREINDVLQSAILEEKSYSPY